MRFLADENLPQAAAKELARRGFDIVSIAVAAPGARDIDVIERARREQRVLLTFDKDFGELARGRGAAHGIVLFRLPVGTPGKIGVELADLICSRNDWVGHFSVVEPGRIRMRPLA